MGTIFPNFHSLGTCPSDRYFWSSIPGDLLGGQIPQKLRVKAIWTTPIWPEGYPAAIDFHFFFMKIIRDPVLSEDGGIQHH